MTPLNGAVDSKSPARSGIWKRRWKRFGPLLAIGVGLKRWAVIGAFGVAVWSIGFAWLMRQFFDVEFPNFLPWYLEGFLLLLGCVDIW